ncbi:MAG: N-acetylmuramoyl-L-alanine amidase [Bacteroidota bacterium]
MTSRKHHIQKFCWILDNGHGRFTRGKRSPMLKDGRQLFEYEFNRAIVRRIAEELDRRCVANVILVPEIDCGNFVKGRTERANDFNRYSNLPTRLVSIHANAHDNNDMGGGWSTAHGIETLHYPSRQSTALAQVFQKHLIKHIGWRDRGTKPRTNLCLLRESHMPAVMTETGFMTNLQECLELMNGEVRNEVAMAHVEAIMEAEGNAFILA